MMAVMLCGEEYVICRMDDQVGSVVGERVEALLTVGEVSLLLPSYYLFRDAPIIALHFARRYPHSTGQQTWNS